ncbi:MAG TPA: hypothetical protein VM370_01600 [Candidatus Thermoplasmatota archaeon]|nr:hypothetical protein [Candidatus Thermoplasmatota archaeon]
MRLAPAAWLAVATHIAAGLGSLILLRPGSPLEPDAAARGAYVATHLAAWRVGWALWIVAALSFWQLLRALAPRAAPWVLAGLAFDVPSQLVLATPLPWTDLAYRGSGVVANGLYTWALWLALRDARMPRWLAIGGIGVVLLGVAVSAASIPSPGPVLFAAIGALTAAIIAWCAALGVRASRASS